MAVSSSKQPRAAASPRPEAGTSPRTSPARTPTRTPTPGSSPELVEVGRRRRRGQVVLCGWCREPITVAATGRPPKWCSSTCRHRAWEAARAAAAGVARVVEVVDRPIEVEVIRQAPPQEVRIEVDRLPRGGPAWADALRELAAQLDRGRVYDRDLREVSNALTDVLNALQRRPGAPRLR